MSTIVTRSGKGAALTHTEVDANFTNLNADKAATADVILATQKGAASGVCPLDATSKVASTYLPSYVDDVLEYANLAALPVTGETGKIYVALDTNKTYRWSGSAYIYITSGAVDSVAGKTGVVTLTSADVGLGNVTNNAAVANLSGTNTGDQTLPTTLPASDVYAWAKAATKPTYTATEVSLGNANNTSDANKPISTATQTALDLKAPISSPTFTGTVSGVSKAMVGLGSVDNTTDIGKPISTATQTALDLKSPLASPTFTGTTTAANLAYTGTLTGSTGILNIGSGQVYKDASGNVGIGTSSPGAMLHISKTAAAAPTVGAFLSNNDNTVGTEVRLGFAANTNLLSQDRYGWIGYLNTGGTNGGALTFATTPGGTPATERMRIDSSGNVGIGVTPSTILHVKSAAPQFRLETTGAVTTGGAAYNTIADSTSSQVWVNGFAGLANCYQFTTNFTNGFMRFMTGVQVEAMRIDSSGNVGIGTTVTPSSSGLSVGSTGIIRQVLGGLANTSWRIRERDYVDSVSWSTNINDAGVQDDATKSSWSTQQGYGGGQDMWRVGRWAAGSPTFVEAMRIDTSGNVGIGTSNPSQRLTISDTGSGLNRDLAVRNGDATNYHQLAIGYNAGALNSGVPANSLFMLAEKGGGYGTVGGLSLGTIGAAPTVFITNGTPRMTIDSSGNVGIGLTSPILNSVLSIAQRNSTGNGSNTLTLDHYYANNKYIQFSWYGTNIGSISQASGTFIVIDSPALAFQTGSIDRMRIDSAGNLLVGGHTSPTYSSKLSIYAGATTGLTYNVSAATGGSVVTNQQQSTSVSTSAVAILTPSQYASFCVVFGSDGTNRFMDLILCGLGTGTIQVVSSFTVSGSPAARTYTQSSSTYRLAMGSGTYTVNVSAITMTG